MNLVRFLPRGLALATALCLTLPAATAADLYVGATNTVFARGSSTSGNFQTLGACGGSIHALVQGGDDLFLGDVNGNVYRYRISQQQLGYAFTAGNNAAALALSGRDLYVGGSNSTVERRDAVTFALVSSWTLSVPVTSLEVRGMHLYAGSSLGVVQRGDRNSGGFQFWGTCGGPVTALAADSTHLILGTASGTIYRIQIATGAVSSSFTVPSDATALVVDNQDLLVGGSNGVVRRVNRFTGAPIASITWAFPVAGMALGAAPVGSAFCFGVGCPCGNDDATGGCRNSTGQGAHLSASGSPSVAADDLVLLVTRMPANTVGRLYMGAGTTHVPFGDGFQCAGTGGYGLFRFPVQSAAGVGTFAFGPGIGEFADSHFTPTGHVFPGQTWHFEAWYRNPLGPCGSGFNTTNAVSVAFAP